MRLLPLVRRSFVSAAVLWALLMAPPTRGQQPPSAARKAAPQARVAQHYAAPAPVVGGLADGVPAAAPEPGEQGFALEECPPEGGDYFGGPGGSTPTLPQAFAQLEMRTSATHGRALGPGQPLRGTSWLNRPYDVSLDYGAFLMIDRVSPNVKPANDYFGALGIGWDFDYYWGLQYRIGWSTPNLENTRQPTADGANNLFLTDLSVLYYPWGDSRLRPYYRLGFGLTDLKFPTDDGTFEAPFLFTMPIGIGVKYQTERWLALRAEFIDNLAFGQNETGTLNNLTLTFGAEWRFGGKPTGYQAWRRGANIW